MGKISKRIITGILCVALIIGFIPNFNAPINAESETIHLTQQDFYDAKNGSSTKGISYSSYGNEYTLKEGSYVLDENINRVGNLVVKSGSFEIDLNNKTISARITADGSDDGTASVTINGGGIIYDGVASIGGASVIINGTTITNIVFARDKGNLIINSSVVKAEVYAIHIGEYCKATINGGEYTGTETGLYVDKNASVSISGGTFTYDKDISFFDDISVSQEDYHSAINIKAEDDESDAKKAFDALLADGYEYDNQSQFVYSFDELSKEFYTNQSTITVKKKSVTPDNKQVTPEENKETTDTNEDKSSTSSNSYQNEWVDHQWYDSNGNATYKYKGYWKKNSTGWWFEDEKGWYPQDQWQKIDGKWYFFDTIGYMAQNEYAGSWGSYSEGNWWVGDDGAWDGSEPGVWRLSTNGKWWFKDSTGWYAKSKWYKIRGTWYYFDDDGWWDESKTE